MTQPGRPSILAQNENGANEGVGLQSVFECTVQPCTAVTVQQTDLLHYKTERCIFLRKEVTLTILWFSSLVSETMGASW